MPIAIIYASITGNSEKIALRISDLLEKVNVEHQLIDLEEKDAQVIEPFDKIILVTSTWGAGVVNYNLDKFYRTLSNIDLTNKSFVLIGLGDMNYGEYYFCKVIDLLNETIIKQHGVVIGDLYKIDGDIGLVSDETLSQWIKPLFESA